MSRMSFVGRDQWRGKGRPKTTASQEVIDALRQTSADGPIVRVPLESTAGTRARAAEMAQYRRELNAAARVLGVRVKTQEQDNALLFYQWPVAPEREDDDGE